MFAAPVLFLRTREECTACSKREEGLFLCVRVFFGWEPVADERVHRSMIVRFIGGFVLRVFVGFIYLVEGWERKAKIVGLF